MVRKTKEDTEHTYSLLLDAAESIFSQKGVAASTLNDIATEAGMTRGAIYWHFKDKGALVRAMCDRATLPMEAMANEVMAAAGDDPLGSLRKLTVHALKQTAESARQHTVFDILFHKCEKTGELATVFNREEECRNECHTRMQGLFDDAVKQGQLPADTDTKLAMQALHSYMVGLMHEWLLNPTAYDLAKRAETLVETMIAGLRFAPPRRVLRKPASVPKAKVHRQVVLT